MRVEEWKGWRAATVALVAVWIALIVRLMVADVWEEGVSTDDCVVGWVGVVAPPQAARATIAEAAKRIRVMGRA